LDRRKNSKVIYPELSYRLAGIAFEVYNDLGFGHKEVYYQRAFAAALETSKLSFEKEKVLELSYKDKQIGKYILDFVVDNKIVVELKVRPKLGYIHIQQVLSYLKQSGLKLAILIYFTKNGVKYRRISNSAV
jgi:GxxExxY protein